jgi:hypothetical protein
MVKKSLLLAGVFATLGVVSLASISTASADTNGSTLAEKIAHKFNLKQDEVQKVLDENREEKDAEHRAKFEERLTTAVKDGKLTEDQKTKILAKISELEQERQQDRDKVKAMSEEDRHTFMKQKRDALDEWAQQNNIPKEYLRMGPHGPHHSPHPKD